ncbi:MAG TPA: hypothetical protein VG934_01310 [Candidatus Paceibacterota bacterium]|nr:hypothetical protein [Candidatus Paceibacterota bacterium]
MRKKRSMAHKIATAFAWSANIVMAAAAIGYYQLRPEPMPSWPIRDEIEMHIAMDDTPVEASSQTALDRKIEDLLFDRKGSPFPVKPSK